MKDIADMPFEGMAGLEDLTSPALRHAAAVTLVEDRFLDEMQSLFEGWCERRHRMLGSMVELVAGIDGDGGRVTMSDAGMRWMTGSLERFGEDLDDQYRIGMAGLRCLEAAMKALPPAQR